MKKIMKKMLVLSVFSSLGGCATMNLTNYENKEIPPNIAIQIAEDGSILMATKFPAGKTTLSMRKNGYFGYALMGKLRQKGFAVSDKGGMNFHYLLDTIAPNRYRLGLITPVWRTDVMYSDVNGNVSRLNQTQRIDDNE